MVRLLAELIDLVLPLECAACRRPGDSWCRRCSAALARSRLAPSVRQVAPDPVPTGFPSCFAWGQYTGPLRAGIRSWKDGGRRDLDRGLAVLLASAMADALRGPAPTCIRPPGGGSWAAGPVLIITVPSSARAVRLRGDRPLEQVTHHALECLAGDPGPRPPLLGPVDALHHRRVVADQAGLGAVGRSANLQSSMEVAPRTAELVRGRLCLIVDDVVTTGSTLAEAARAVRAAGATDVRAAVIAATRRRSGP
ncbi:phosphoribosyltransferase family protein [Intrasporangium sp.]|uniref:ComF family protein n=1 Tax=Intrasporangium sp. TaxID=1925024 RepID=UPI003365AB9A